MAVFFPVSPVIRGQRLEESLEYQQFVANVEEEEAWINEKMTLVASEDYGDTLAAIQVGGPAGASCLPSAAACRSPCPAGLLAGRVYARRAQPAATVSEVVFGPQVSCQRPCPSVDKIGLTCRPQFTEPCVNWAVFTTQVTRTLLVSCICHYKVLRLGSLKQK